MSNKLLALLACLALPACSDLGYEPVSGPTLAGTYVIDATHGEFLYTDDQGHTYDLAAEGSKVSLKINSDGSILTYIFVPAENESAQTYEVEAGGTWQLLNHNTVAFSHGSAAEPTVISTMPFVVVGNQLVGRKQYTDGAVSMTLVR